MKERSFVLSDLPPDVVAVEAIFEVDPESGYVMCRASDEWIVWRYFRSGEKTVFSWGHYTPDRDDALRNLFERTGFGRVEALVLPGVTL